MGSGAVRPAASKPAAKPAAPKPAAPKPATPKPASTTRSTTSTGSSASRSSTTSPTSGSTGTANRNGSSSSQPTDSFKASGEKAESTSSRVNNIVKGLEQSQTAPSSDNPETKPAEQGSEPKDPRAKLFKDEQRLEKLSKTREDLQKAKDGTHEKLEDIRSRQDSEKSEALAEEKKEATRTQKELEEAEANLEATESEIKKRTEEAPQQREEALQTGQKLASELRDIESPTGGVNLHNDVLSTQRTLEEGPRRLENLKRSRDATRNSEMRGRLDQAISKHEKQLSEAKKRSAEMQSNPEYGDKVKSFLDAKKAYQDADPAKIRETNASERSAAQSRASSARQEYDRAQAELGQAEKTYDQTHDSANQKELQEAKDQLTSDLGAKLEDLSTIKRDDLAEGITKSSAFGGSWGDFQAELTEDGMKIQNNGRDVSVSPKENGGYDVSSQKTEDSGRVQSVDSEMVQDKDGSWREARTQTKNWKSERDQQLKRTPSSESTTQRFEDGSSVSKSRSRTEGDNPRTTTSQTVKSADGRTVSDSSTQYDDGWSYKTHNESNKNDKTSSSVTTSENADGSYSNTKSRQVDENGRITETDTTYSESSYREPGVHGIGWFPGNSPEDLRGALGDDPVHAEITTKTSVSDSRYDLPKTSVSKSHRWTSQDGDKTLDYQEGQKGAPDTYKFSRVEGDSVTSQTFQPGSNDTTISESYTDKDGFRVTETQEDHRELAAAVKEQIGETLPVGGESVTREKEEARVEDLSKILADTHGFEGMEDSEAVQEFMQHIGDGQFNLASHESVTSNDPKGQDEDELFDPYKNKFESNGQVLAMAPDGSRLVMRHDSKTGQQVAQFVRPGEEGQEDYHALTMANEQGQRLEVNSDGEAFHIDPGQVAGGVRTAIKDADLVGGLGTKGVHLGAKSALWARKLARLGHTSDTSDALKGLKALDNKYSGSFAHGFDGAATVLSLTNSFSSSMNGDYGAATRHAVQAANDLGGFAGLAKNAAGKLSTVGKIGTFLGFAGAVTNAGFAANDIYNGDYIRGGLGLAGATGSAMGMVGSLWAGASWAGPVGWGIAAAASIGTLTYDYIDSTSIADPTQGLLR